MKLYILVNKEPKEASHEEWQEWKTKHDRDCLVLRSQVYGADVETRFVGFDVQGAGYLFRSQIRGGDLDGEVCRAKTWDLAEECHWEMCNMVRRKAEKDILEKSRTK